MFFLRDTIYFVKCISSSYKKNSPMLPPPYLRLGWCSQALKHLFFFLQMQQWSFSPKVSTSFSIDHRKCLQVCDRSLSLCVFANCSLAFSCVFWRNDFLFAEWPVSPWQCRTCLTVDSGTLLAASVHIFTRSSTFVLWF